eukprot:CAMPEP_0117754522 /NCGR_PEP_ID=MMETSP0947-20121206/12878_1 /TAXON_ID=44440 /ORGANISM="Chattonella subsalsa, Strain CCMP2191" /LENGTH=349 /DNA_ID=CAMNT_0005573625 /DNA_START=346 /DNA_END=1395 /DNA_ORIENTATION=+
MPTEQNDLMNSSSSSSVDSSDLEIENLLDFEIWPAEILELNTSAYETESNSGSGIDSKVKFYLQWVDALVVLKGGKVSEGELYRVMENSNSTLYASIMKEFGGVIQLIMSHSDNFQIVNDAPFKWSIVSRSARNVHSTKPKMIKPSQKLKPRQLDQRQIEQVVRTAQEILQDTSTQELKAVELANTLRACVGTDALSQVKEHFGGLLVLLQKYPAIFTVKRIPKNDMVCLTKRSSEIAYGTVDIEEFTPQYPTIDPFDCIYRPEMNWLTSEKWVPGKIWPADAERDGPIIRAIADQLLQNAAPITVSKLRGLIRIQLNSKDTIKSVPLKALISAYSHVFSLSGNKVSLR